MSPVTRRRALSLLPAACAAVAAPLAATAAVAEDPALKVRRLFDGLADALRDEGSGMGALVFPSLPGQRASWDDGIFPIGDQLTGPEANRQTRDWLIAILTGDPRQLANHHAAGVAAADMEPHDPLLDLIQQFNSGWERYVALPDDEADDFYAEAVGPLLDQLTDECPPVTTQAGALAALRLILEGDEDGAVAFVPRGPLVKAALGYVEGRA